jgi:hypothetical protein
MRHTLPHVAAILHLCHAAIILRLRHAAIGVEHH